MFEKVELIGTITKIVEHNKEDDWIECLIRVVKGVTYTKYEHFVDELTGTRYRKGKREAIVKAHFAYDADLKEGTIVKCSGFFAEGKEPLPDIEVKQVDSPRHFEFKIDPLVIPITADSEARYFRAAIDGNVPIMPVPGPRMSGFSSHCPKDRVHTFTYRLPRKVKIFFVEEHVALNDSGDDL